jgi:hypothetical protein
MVLKKQDKDKVNIRNMVVRLVRNITKRNTMEADKVGDIHQRLAKIHQRQRRKRMGKTIANLLKKVVKEETLVSILLVVGDYLVEISSNKLDNKVWEQVKKALKKK